MTKGRITEPEVGVKNGVELGIVVWVYVGEGEGVMLGVGVAVAAAVWALTWKVRLIKARHNTILPTSSNLFQYFITSLPVLFKKRISRKSCKCYAKNKANDVAVFK
jgi:hypothetical protein